MPSPRGLRARRASRSLPEVEPIVPVERPTPFNDSGWLFEPKYDGFRGLAYLTPDECTIRSKRGNTFLRFASLCASIRAQAAARTAILDGEVLAVDSSGRPVFTDLLSSGGRLAYVAFDLLWLDGRDLRDLP